MRMSSFHSLGTYSSCLRYYCSPQTPLIASVGISSGPAALPFLRNITSSLFLFWWLLIGSLCCLGVCHCLTVLQELGSLELLWNVLSISLAAPLLLWVYSIFVVCQIVRLLHAAGKGNLRDLCIVTRDGQSGVVVEYFFSLSLADIYTRWRITRTSRRDPLMTGHTRRKPYILMRYTE